MTALPEWIENYDHTNCECRECKCMKALAIAWEALIKVEPLLHSEYCREFHDERCIKDAMYRIEKLGAAG